MIEKPVVKSEFDAVPVSYLAKCQQVPVLKTGEINEVKTRYKQTQSMLINQCIVHGDLVDWLERMVKPQ